MKRNIFLLIIFLFVISCTGNNPVAPTETQEESTFIITSSKGSGDPVFTPAAGTFQVCPTIRMTSSITGATIKFTRDGSDPKASPTAEIYTTSFAFNGTIKAYAYKGETQSNVVTGVFNVTGVMGGIHKTGQIISYDVNDDGASQSGAAWPNPRFVDKGDGTITDNLTGLMWEKVHSTNRYPWFNERWPSAYSRIKEINNTALGGHKDWRLPNLNELKSLLNHGVKDQAQWLVSQGFTGMQNANASWRYWSSTTYAASPNNAWYINIYDGTVNHDYIYGYDNLAYYYVMAVRSKGAGVITLPRTGQTKSYTANDDGAYQSGAVSPYPRFVNNGNGTITDNLTGLMWQRAASSTQYNWRIAIKLVADINLKKIAGYSDWRLPNINELRSLINWGQSESASWLNTQGFIGINQNYFWSSTTYIRNTENAWYIDMAYNYVDERNKYNYGYAIAVRTGIQ